MRRIQFPHCDEKIVHSPEENCKYCNESGLQEIRKAWNINFTGQHDPNKTTCPAEQRRPLNTINKWYGNVPHTPERQASLDSMWDDFFKQRQKDIDELTEKRKRDYWSG